jgi:hypothetical protein
MWFIQGNTELLEVASSRRHANLAGSGHGCSSPLSVWGIHVHDFIEWVVLDNMSIFTQQFRIVAHTVIVNRLSWVVDSRAFVTKDHHLYEPSLAVSQVYSNYLNDR